MEGGENGVPSYAVSPRTASAKEHESVNVTIPLNPMEVRGVSEQILNPNLALPICVVSFHFSFHTWCFVSLFNMFTCKHVKSFFIGCATVDRYPPKLKQGCRNQFSCTKLKNMNKCSKSYNQAMSKWCRNQITPWWRSQVVKVHCKKSCCKRKCIFKCTFMLCLLYQTYPKWICYYLWQLLI